MSHTFQCTFNDDIAAELEQYVYGKTGKTVSHWMTDALLGQASKNPLTVPQFNRIVRRYQESTIISLDPLAVPLGQNKSSQ